MGANETIARVCLMDLEPHRLSLTGHGGLPIAADSWGDTGAPPVLLLHGGGQTRHAWRATARRLAASGFHALTADLRGHGDTAWADDGDYRLEVFGHDLIAVARRLPAPPAVVGASLGGLAALVAEGELAPGTTSAVVLVDVGPRLEPEGVARIVGFMGARPDGFESLEDASEAVAEYLPHRPRPTDLGGLAKNLRLGADGRYRWHWDPAFLTGTQRPSASTDSERLFRAARALRVPTLLVRGRQSDTLSEAAAAEFLAAVPHARYADVAGARHMVAGDRNDVFSNAVVTFLDEELQGGADHAPTKGEATS